MGDFNLIIDDIRKMTQKIYWLKVLQNKSLKILYLKLNKEANFNKFNLNKNLNWINHKIQAHMERDNILILRNLETVYPTIYDLFN